MVKIFFSRFPYFVEPLSYSRFLQTHNIGKLALEALINKNKKIQLQNVTLSEDWTLASD